MTLNKQNINILEPKNQLKLYGYHKWFSSFHNLYRKKILPNIILLSGPKGIGKSTFCYHFANFLLSQNESNYYLIDNYCINENNSSYQLVKKNIHPNFFLLEVNRTENEIKIEKVRELLNFLSKSTYSMNFKIILIDNLENLNLSSSNALLKAIEEPQPNTFFFLTHSIENQILDTIKSRCNTFKLFFSLEEKKDIFQNLIKQYDSFDINDYNQDDCYYLTPGNFIKYLSTLDLKKHSKDDIFINISNLIIKYKKDKDLEVLYFISLFIEKFYHNLTFKNPKKVYSILSNFSLILKQISNLKKFNLDDKATFIWIENILKNEER